jgi:hypothetical protein
MTTTERRKAVAADKVVEATVSFRKEKLQLQLRNPLQMDELAQCVSQC